MANDKPAVPPPSPSKRKAVVEETLLISVIKRYFKYASGAILIWGFGYNGFSPAWILLGLIIVVWKEKHTKLQQKKIEISQQAARNEKEAILARVEDLPSWVFFPDVERAEWMNKMIAQMWPFIGDYVQNLLMTSVQKTVQSSASVMGSFKFINIDLGDIPPRIGGVKVYTENVKRDEIYMDLDIIYSSDCEIEVQVKGLKAGIKDLQLHGTLRVIFKPLLSTIPLFGGLSFFFLNNPHIDFNLTSLANALDIPGLNDMLHTIIQENIANIMVLPNRIAIEMVKGVDITRLRYPQPHGILRIHVLGAKDLKKADISLMGKGKSDPYAVIKVGAQKFKTHVINNSLSPEWNCVFETIIDEKDGQFMEIEVRDEDPGSKDDKLGTVSIDLSPVAEKGVVDNWLPLEDVKTGKLHLKLVWLYLTKDPLVLSKSLTRPCEKASIAASKLEKNKGVDDLSSCILLVDLDSARELPRSKKMSEPSAFVTLNVGQKTEDSKIANDSTDPRWEQGFRFLVNDPSFQTLDVKVTDKKSDKFLGELTYNLKHLLTAPDMTVDQYFQLKKSDGNSEIQMRLSLRVLTTEKTMEFENMMVTNEDGTLPGQESDVDQAPTSTSDSGKPKPQTAGASGTSKGPSSPTGAKPKTGPPQMSDKAGPPQMSDITSSHVAPVSSQPIPPASKRDDGAGEMRQRKTTSSASSTKGEFELGRIQVTIRYSSQRGKLIIVVHKCTGLLACDKDNFSDPYVRMYLLPDKGSSSKRKTKVINNNLDPVFDETFDYSVTPQELPGRSLLLEVKNKNSMFSSSQDMLGVAEVDLSQFDINSALTEWYDLRPEDMKKESDV